VVQFCDFGEQVDCEEAVGQMGKDVLLLFFKQKLDGVVGGDLLCWTVRSFYLCF
jgi:hypothetical protein